MNEQHGMFGLVKKHKVGAGGSGSAITHTSASDVAAAIQCFEDAYCYYQHLHSSLRAVIDAGGTPVTNYCSETVRYVFNGAHARRQGVDIRQVCHCCIVFMLSMYYTHISFFITAGGCTCFIRAR